MIEKLKLVYSNQEKEDVVSLHSSVVDILFEHRRYVKNIFLQIKGHYEVAYFGLSIISPSNELVSFSSMPHVEYNLIQQGLWKYDTCFSSKKLSKNTLLWWDDINADNLFVEQIKEIKLTSNHFKSGMTLSREINGFNFLYSYATSSNKKNLKEYYSAQIFGLIDIGDYFCNSVLNLYSEYCGNYSLPQLNQLNSKASDLGLRSKLKLIVNNL
ncbi:hypothetical protein [Legionella sp.]|uniref:hypothetical protein n=1 Tax=Legionella sp. TaxID=459 RepID=UPI003C8B8664